MKDTGSPDPLLDDLAALLEAAAAEPARVEYLKAQLRAQLARRQAVAAPRSEPAEDAEDEDLWNNLPL
jgi:hypothetical protein